MILRNRSGSTIKKGFLVKAVRGGFDYAAAGDTPIGVITQVAPKSNFAIIKDAGTVKVSVDQLAVAGNEIRMPVSGEGGRAGTGRNVGSETEYISIGQALEAGKGLINVALSIKGVGAGGDVEEAPIDGDIYGRIDAGWTVITAGIGEAALDGIAYSRHNANWVNANLVVDYSGGTGVQTTIIEYGERITFVGDGTYISTGYQFIGAAGSGVHEIEISLAPGALDTRWDIMTADGTIATARPYTTAQIGNTANVAFLEGVYTSISYALNTQFTDYSPTLTEPANEVTIEVDYAKMKTDGIIYYQSDVDTLLSGYATQGWVTSNFDNYVSWDLQTGGVSRETITSGFALDFIGDTTYIQVQYNTTDDRLEFSYVGPTGFYTAWNVYTNGVFGQFVGSGTDVDFIDGSNVSITHNWNSGTQTNEITFNSTDQYVGTVTSVDTAGTENGLTLTGGPFTTSGTITLGGSLAISNSDWLGTDLSVGNGGTGLSYVTSDYLLTGNNANALTAESNLRFSGSALSITGSVTPTSGIYTNNVYERTAANGVDVDGVVMKDKFVTAYAFRSDVLTTDYTFFTRTNGTNSALYIQQGSPTGTIAQFRYNSATPGGGTLAVTISNTGIAATAEITAYSSDGRLKTNINVISDPFKILDPLEGVTFDWRDGIEELGFIPSRKSEHGFIAQNLQRVMPEAVAPAPFDIDSDGLSISGDNYLTTKPEKLIPVLVEAVKQLNARLIAMERLNAKY